ncbi:DUF2987 domain-containing protein [Algicola sagamiensis]|uniref:DUF2987 domain-containing protein n=1 Tax=Algicola sagamiensis TaxID=163869 RepID=UPI0003801E54|nr:DUF2987 domain-containing protein [Algicola sagamiensis]
MKHIFKNMLVLVALMVPTASLYAKPVYLGYDGFYDRLKVSNKKDYPDVRIGFYLIDEDTRQPCHIKEGSIQTEKSSQPLVVGEESEMLVPFDKQLDKDKAMIIVETEQYCVLKMQIEAQGQHGKRVSAEQLKRIQSQMADILDDLSGFIASFFTPDVTGVRLVFAKKEHSKQAGIQCDGMKCSVNAEQLANNVTLSFDQEIVQILPRIE